MTPLRAYTLGIVIGIAFTICVVCLIAAAAEPDYVLVRIPRDQLEGPPKQRKLASVTPIRRELEQPAASSPAAPPPEAGA